MALTKERVLEEMGRGAALVNVLLPENYDDLHIRGSLNIPLEREDEPFAGEVERQVGRDRLVIAYCSNLDCHLGLRAARILRRRGFQAEDYPGGTREWAESGLPVDGKRAGDRDPRFP